MKKFETPKMNVMKLTSEEIFTESPQCTVAALGCASCYCVAVTCDHNPECPGCYNDWETM